MKHYIFRLKHGLNLCDDSIVKNGMLYHKGVRVFNLKSIGRLTVNAMAKSFRTLRLEGMTDLYLLGDTFEVGVVLNDDKFIKLDIHENTDRKLRTFAGDEIPVKKKFTVDIPQTDAPQYRFVARKKEIAEIELMPQFNLSEN